MINCRPEKANSMKILISILCTCLWTGIVLAEEAPEFHLDWEWVETPFGKPVIDRGATGAWDHYAVDNPYVYTEGNKLYCFFEAQDVPSSAPLWHEQIGIAVSDDGIHWTKSDKTNPILQAGAAGSWDHPIAKLPAGVVKRDGVYHLFYSGRNKITKQIGLATATRLEGPWIKSKRNPVIPSRPDHWDRMMSTHPSPVFEVNGKFYLLFRGMQAMSVKEGVGVAASSDLLNWKRIPESDQQPAIPIAAQIQSLAMAQTKNGFVGICQPVKLKERRYWFSKDLVHWKPGPFVKVKASRQAETLSNPFFVNGQWNVLYEQKDRIYRAVLQPKQE